jgi:hypothetical protein
METDADPLHDDEIIAGYYGHGLVSFFLPRRQYHIAKPKHTVDNHIRVTVSLDDWELQGHGQIPESRKQNIAVYFFYDRTWKVWVSIPYAEARRRLPQLPQLPDGPELGSSHTRP